MRFLAANDLCVLGAKDHAAAVYYCKLQFKAVAFTCLRQVLSGIELSPSLSVRLTSNPTTCVQPCAELMRQLCLHP